MPTPEQIRTKYAQLPLLKEHCKLREGNAWKANEKGGHFSFFRIVGDKFYDKVPEKIILTVSGSESAKKKIYEDFINALGEPSGIEGNEPRNLKNKEAKIRIIWKRSA